MNEKEVLSSFPELIKWWNFSKNNEFNIDDLTRGSNKVVWWTCPNGHEFQKSIKLKFRSYLKGKSDCIECNSLQYLHPEILSLWNYDKNKDFNPNSISPHSSKFAWWQCKEGHEWKDSIINTTTRGNCPYCSGVRVSNENSLKFKYPDIAKQWHPNRNEGLNPHEVHAYSNKKAWFVCEKGHEWETVIGNRINRRTNKVSGCPYCSGHKLTKENSLEILYPNIAKEWHPTKNGNLLPILVASKSHKKVWWLCQKGHEWKTTISHRSNGSNCPECNKEKSTSFPEQILYFYLKKVFKDTLNRHTFNVNNRIVEVDIFIPVLNLAIEYDGKLYHIDKKEADENKDILLSELNISLIRIRENGLPLLDTNSFQISCTYDYRYKYMNLVLKQIINYIHSLNLEKKQRNSISKLVIDIERDKDKIYNTYLSTKKSKSIGVLFPQLTEEWHPTKNGQLTPFLFTKGSHYKAWWICSNGHEWESYISNRTKGAGCPYCSNNKVHKENSLSFVRPDIASQWDYEKNGDLTPEDVTKSANIRLWWICEKGHSWDANLNARTGKNRGCPYCSGRRVLLENSLYINKPNLLEIWDYNKNIISPEEVSVYSHKKVWWKCSNNHFWEEKISQVSTRDGGCPYCSNLKVCNTNSLEYLHPEIADLWNKDKNGSLLPSQVVSGSSKYVWWICNEGHEFKQKIANIVIAKNKCPHCKTQ